MFVLINNQPSETRSSARQLAKNYIDCGDPFGWFEALYLAADENPNNEVPPVRRFRIEFI